MKTIYILFALLSFQFTLFGQNCPTDINNSPGNSSQTILATVYDTDGNIVEEIVCEQTGNASPQIDCDLDDRNYPAGYSVVITISQGQNSVDCVYDNQGFFIGVLPVELISFDVFMQKGNSVLTWTTASERNNDYFTVEYSLDGFLFEEVATIKGAGNSSSFNSYKTTHTPTGNKSIVYYRLSQTDFDGTTVDLGTRAVLRGDFEELTVYSKLDRLIIQNNSNEKIHTLTIFDLTGQVIFQQANSSETQVEVELMQNKVYLIHVLFENGGYQTLKVFH